MAESYFMWAIVLIAIAVILFFLEVFVPSGGILSLFAAVSLIAGIVLLFWVDPTIGLVGAIVTTAAIPFFIILALRMWPHTPIARMLTLDGSTPDDEEEQQAEAQARQALIDQPQPLEGQVGTALTDMRPVGTCQIAGRREQCLAEGGMINAGTKVRVTSADGMQIKVRAVEE